jgi:branched-chain amino acid aminotransferase
MARTFELQGEALGLVGESRDLREASEGLPQGSYTTMRTYRGSRLLRFDHHVARLRESAAQLGGSEAELAVARARRAVALALRATGHAESRLRLTWAPPRLFISVEPFAPPPASLYEDGAWCVTAAVQRERPQAKDTRFLASVAAGYDRLPPGAHEALIVGEDGSLLEGLSSNFFAVAGGRLHTEESRALHGVTRAIVLELAAQLLPVVRSALSVGQLAALDEAFITSVSRGIVPVVRIDDRTIGAGRPGPVGVELRRRFDALVEREAASVDAA